MEYSGIAFHEGGTSLYSLLDFMYSCQAIIKVQSVTTALRGGAFPNLQDLML